MRIKTDYIKNQVKEHELELMRKQANGMLEQVVNKTGAGNDFLGWVDLPTNYDKDEFTRIKQAAKKIKAESEVLVVIGIGGSYLGAKAVLDIFNNPFTKNDCEIIFAGHNMSAAYLANLVEYVKTKEFSINVISKSGTTTEPAIAFRVLKQVLTDKYGDSASERIYATTDSSKGALRKQVEVEGYESFIIPDDVGGRFSVLTAVGLLPICVSGIDIDALMTGAKTAQDELSMPNNLAVEYASIRNCMYNKGVNIEVLVNYDPRLVMLSEWWKQLYGESEGKDQKGIFPASVTNSTDLHSMGQYLQDGRRNLFETVIKVLDIDKRIVVEKQASDDDALNYLDGKYLDEINNIALDATVMAHVSGNASNVILEVEKLDEYNVGYLIYFFEMACAISGYLLGVNPFNQPGVESYKKNMFALLDKPGFEELKQELTKKQ